MTRLPEKAQLDWTDAGAPRSVRFGDVYFSRSGGLAEAEVVFLQGCGLPETWRARDRFTIVELGFGAGLNALAAWRLWRRERRAGAILHFVSIEAFPLDVGDAARAHAAFPELASLSARLREAWPVRMRAPQRAFFADEGFALTVLQRPARDALRELVCEADAWFLDGFSPARNPDMWCAELMHLIAARSADGARLATYSVAGDVRRGLESAGFVVEKKPGFGAKKERLEAVLKRGGPRNHPLFPAGATPGRIAIIGGGIAGAAAAHALRRRNRDCTIWEAETLGAGASGGPAAMVMPRLDRGGDHAEMHLAGFVHAVRLYEQLSVFESRGVREAPGARDLAAIADLTQDPPLPSEWLGASNDGLYHARAGLVDTRALIAALTAASKVSIARIGAIVRKDAVWRLCDDTGNVVDEVESVIIATGASLKRFKESDWLPLRLSRGQIEWAKGVQLQVGVSSGAFAAPFRGGVLFGATFDHVETEYSVLADEQSRVRNLAALTRLAPDVARAIHSEQLVSRVALRASTPDFAPLVGLMPDSQLWLAQNAGVALGRNPPALEAPSLRGLYIFGGLGARGFTLAPMLAESLASELCGEPPPLSRPTLDTIHPARFLLRSLKKKEGISDYP